MRFESLICRLVCLRKVRNLVISCIKKCLKLNLGHLLGEFCSILELIYGSEKDSKRFRDIQVDCNVLIKICLNFFL